VSDRRIRAETVETDDGYEVLPPELGAATESVPTELVEAVEAALDDAPNTLVEPRVRPAGESDSEHYVAKLFATYQELPALDDSGDLRGWKAPYQAREKFDAALREHLPDRWVAEAVNNGTTGFYDA